MSPTNNSNGESARRNGDSRIPRRHERFDLELEATISILIAEDTFEPMDFEGKVVDVSVKGMRVRQEALPRRVYAKLLLKTRSATIQFNDPRDGSNISLTGRIAWIDYVKKTAGQMEGPCQFGLSFDASKDLELADYARFVNALEVV